MPRLMSFAMTAEQILNRTKTVTRRKGWAFLKPGEELRAVDKCMGFRKGEKPTDLARIRVVSVERQHLDVKSVTPDEMAKEGLPDMDPRDFIEALRAMYREDRPMWVTRIEFEYVEEMR